MQKHLLVDTNTEHLDTKKCTWKRKLKPVAAGNELPIRNKENTCIYQNHCTNLIYLIMLWNLFDENISEVVKW